MFATFCFLAAIGILMNSLLIYMIGTNEKMSTPKLMMMYLSGSNIMQLISRILTIAIPDQRGTCYPMSSPCKIAVLLLCTARKGSMSFTIFLGVFRLMKIENKPFFVLTNTHVHLALAATWLLLIAGCFPYIILIPTNRHHQNLNGTCTCTFLHSLTDKDPGVKMFDLVCSTGAFYLTIAIMCFVSIKMVLILLKHQKTVFVDGTLKRYRTRQRNFTAIKAIIALLVCYVTCTSVSFSLTHYREFHLFDLQRISTDIYTLLSPVILGYPYFRKLTSMGWNCHTQTQMQVIAIS